MPCLCIPEVPHTLIVAFGSTACPPFSVTLQGALGCWAPHPTGVSTTEWVGLGSKDKDMEHSWDEKCRSSMVLFVEGKMGLGEGILEVKRVTALLSYCLYYFGIGSAAETTTQNISECAALPALSGQGSSCRWKCAAVQQHRG